MAVTRSHSMMAATADPRRQLPPQQHAAAPFAHGTSTFAMAAAGAAAISSAPQQPQQQALLNSATSTAANVGGSTSINTPAPTAEQLIDQAWIAYDPPEGGTTYYYNTITKISRYDKPEALQKRDAPPPSATTTTTTAKVAVQQQWKEYTDVKTGKKYFSDGTTTTWDKPASMVASAESVAITTTAIVNSENAVADNESGQPPKKKKKTSSAASNRETNFGSKEEAVAAFKGLMLAKEILPSTKWNDVVKLCKSDSRWQACEDVLSMGERKQSLAEYQTKRANELRTMERQEKVRAKEAFLQLLTDKLPVVAHFSAWTSRLDDVRDALSKDDRFHAVATETTRESLFLDFCEEFKKREERKKRNKKVEAKDAFVMFLKEKEEVGVLTFASTWNSFLSALRDEDKSDARFVTSAVMTDSDRQLYFADSVIELQTAEDDKRNRIRGARRRAEKAQREAFEQALHELAANGALTPFSKWRTSEEKISALDSFGPVQDQDRDAPREIFEDFLSEWNDNYSRDRSVLRQVMYPKSGSSPVEVTAETSYENFSQALMDVAANYPELGSTVRRIVHRSEPLSSARLYWQELTASANGGVNDSVLVRRGSSSRRLVDNDSSEDEGEIVEEGEAAAVEDSL